MFGFRGKNVTETTSSHFAEWNSARKNKINWKIKKGFLANILSHDGGLGLWVFEAGLGFLCVANYFAELKDGRTVDEELFQMAPRHLK